jgi:hypothetical protein
MSRALSLTSSFFSAAFVILLVLGFLVLGGPAVADELLGSQPLTAEPVCEYENGSCPSGGCGSDDCCSCVDEDTGSPYCDCLNQGCPRDLDCAAV